jgi:biopolymer transport protein ExbD
VFTRPKKISLALDMAPLLDVVFLLLIFFMLTSTFTPPSLPLDLPEAGGGVAAPLQPVVVSVSRGEEIAVNGVSVTLDSVVPVIREQLLLHGTGIVHFRGDRESSFGLFVRLMDLAREAGANQLQVIHQSLPNDPALP